MSVQQVLCTALAGGSSTAAPAWPQGPVLAGPRGGAGPSGLPQLGHDGRDRGARAPVPGPAPSWGPGLAERLCHARPGASLWLWPDPRS